jgi:hypothetical protein
VPGSWTDRHIAVRHCTLVYKCWFLTYACISYQYTLFLLWAKPRFILDGKKVRTRIWHRVNRGSELGTFCRRGLNEAEHTARKVYTDYTG